MQVYGSTPMIEFGSQQLDGIAEIPSIQVYNLQSEAGALHWPGAHPASAQGYTVEETSHGLALAGGERGCLYGLIDLADTLRDGRPIPTGVRAPAVERRGIKLNIPLDARTPSYSDASDSAWHSIPDMWDEQFWHELLDQLCLDKYNLVSLWNLHPFPSMVRVPGYERVALPDVMRTAEPVFGASMMGYGMMTERLRRSLTVVKRITMDEKIAFWRRVMRYGANRGIDFIVMTWNVFVYGTEGSGYGITDDLDNPVTQDYFRQSVRAMIDTYPLLKGIGVTAGERMSVGRKPDADVLGDVRWLAATYGAGVRDAIPDGRRDFTFIHRQHMSGAKEIQAAFAHMPVKLSLSFKHSQAHMYSSPTPTFGNAFYASLPEGQRTFLTLRNDDLYMHRWGGISFARAYIRHMPLEKMEGFMLGPDGYTWGRDYLQRGCVHRTVLRRRAYEMGIWGRLSYDPSLEDAYFEGYLRRQLATDAKTACLLRQAGEASGWILPRVNMAHWHDFDFQHYPEANCGVAWQGCSGHVGKSVVFHDVHDYISAPAQPGSGRLSVREACALERAGQCAPEGRVTPEQTSAHVERDCAQTIDLLAQLGTLCGEAQDLAEDFRGLALLGLFFAQKLRTAVAVQRVLTEGPGADPSVAIALAEDALARWTRYAAHVDARYAPQRLTRMNGRLVSVADLVPQAREDAQMVCMLMEPYLHTAE